MGVVGAVMLGEYRIAGLVGLTAGLVFGLLVGEAVVAVADRGGRLLGTVAALSAGLGFLGAGWVSTSHDLGRLAPEGWVAVVLAALAAGVRARATRPSPGSRPSTAPEG